jgi:tetratricopeptide (TPR) repeat protein
VFARLRLPLLALALVQVVACSTYKPGGSSPAPVEKSPDYSSKTVTPPPREDTPTAAYLPLLERADQARGRGDYEEALALLERAQRIDSDSADIYLAMARTHQARGDKGQARAVAERGLLYCSGRSQCDALRAYAR